MFSRLGFEGRNHRGGGCRRPPSSPPPPALALRRPPPVPAAPPPPLWGGGWSAGCGGRVGRGSSGRRGGVAIRPPYGYKCNVARLHLYRRVFTFVSAGVHICIGGLSGLCRAGTAVRYYGSFSPTAALWLSRSGGLRRPASGDASPRLGSEKSEIARPPAPDHHPLNLSVRGALLRNHSAQILSKKCYNCKKCVYLQ